MEQNIIWDKTRYKSKETKLWTKDQKKNRSKNESNNWLIPLHE